jgi:hypothetical protein
MRSMNNAVKSITIGTKICRSVNVPVIRKLKRASNSEVESHNIGDHPMPRHERRDIIRGRWFESSLVHAMYVGIITLYACAAANQPATPS